MHTLTRRKFIVDSGKLAIGTSILITAMTGCSNTNTGSNQTLKYWALSYQPHGANQTGKLTDAAIAAYLKTHPTIKVQITGFTGDSVGFTKVSQAVRSGSSVDLFRYPSDNLPLLVTQGLVEPIDDYLTSDDKADIYPNLLDAVKLNGKTYAWPLWVPPVAMYLNLDIFQERGITPPGNNWTYEEFVTIAQQLTFTRPNGQKVYGYSSAVDADIVNVWPIIMGDGGVPLSPDQKHYSFNSPEAISGLQKLVDLARKYKITPPDFGTQSPNDMISGFSQQKNYAMYSAPSGDSSGYAATGMNFAIRTMPIGAMKKPITTGGIGLIAISKTRDQHKLQATMEMARYLTGKQVGKDVSGYYLAPGARRSVTVENPISQFASFVPYTYLMPLMTSWEQIRTLIHVQIQNAILGKVTPAQAMNAPANEINSILANAQ